MTTHKILKTERENELQYILLRASESPYIEEERIKEAVSAVKEKTWNSMGIHSVTQLYVQ